MKFLLLSTVAALSGLILFAQDQNKIPGLPYYLQDRGTGIPTSMFSTFIKKNELILYPYYEVYFDKHRMYKPSDLGFADDNEYQSPKFRGHEGLFFVAYGITEGFALQYEATVVTETIYKAKNDHSTMPSKFNEGGLGSMEFQLRYRLQKESIKKPEIFGYNEIILPLQKNRKLIGTQHLELSQGIGFIKGFKWGTMTVRASSIYDGGEKKISVFEYGLEYMKQVSRLLRVSGILEGSTGDFTFVADFQFHVTPYLYIRLNNAFGITRNASDHAPEVGFLFHF